MDASALKGMVNNTAITDATMLRWILYISTFPVVWRLIKGKLHWVPDGLSRIFSKLPEEVDAANDSGDVEDAIEAMLGLVAACQNKEIVESEAERLWGVFSNRMEASRVFVADFLQYEEDVRMWEVAMFLDGRLGEQSLVQNTEKEGEEEDTHGEKEVERGKEMERGKEVERGKETDQGKEQGLNQVVTVWMLDLVHMPAGSNGKPYLMHMVDRLYGYPEANAFK
ncbi:hypothetical protein HDU77_011564 [Chytriomyces hyalinus]|nr:hypothetical protein HDU77_011564 [Chytriomyces hyalinus]